MGWVNMNGDRQAINWLGRPLSSTYDKLIQSLKARRIRRKLDNHHQGWENDSQMRKRQQSTANIQSENVYFSVSDHFGLMGAPEAYERALKIDAGKFASKSLHASRVATV